MNTGFYRAFEEKYRGSRELIKTRLQAYTPFVEAVKALYPDAKAVDLGCGRGEWLELLNEQGIDASGVDMDEGMLQACRELNLKVENGDAIQFLKKLPNNSQALVSGFHIAEHLPFEVLQTLVQEALRVLKPAGLLILETPNPENIVVGSSTFYLDPTHERPLPHQLLAFLPEYYGYERVKVVRLQESEQLVASDKANLIDVFTGVSPDYSIVAQKTADENVLAQTAHVFDADYGLTLAELANKYERKMEFTADQFYVLSQQAEARAQQAEARAHEQAERAERAEAEARETRLRAEHAEAAANEAEAAALIATKQAEQSEHDRRQAVDLLANVYASPSWKLTYPLRIVKKGVRTAPATIKNQVVRPVVVAGVKFVMARPALRSWASNTSKKFPGLRQRFVLLAHGLQPAAADAANGPSTPKTFAELGSVTMMTSIASTLNSTEEGNEIVFV